MRPQPEKYLTAKEIASRFDELGIYMHVDYARAIVRALGEKGLSVRNKYARFSDAWDFWVLNPGWMPFSRHPERNVGKTEPLGAVLRGLR